MWMRVSASTMRVRVAFSIVNLVFPLCEPQVIVWNQHQHLHHAAFMSKYHQLDTVCQAQQLKEVRIQSPAVCAANTAPFLPGDQCSEPGALLAMSAEVH